MAHNKLRFRQIHMDFHTSPNIAEIGKDFDPEEFATTLKKAKVDSITLFARCHHGLLYYNSIKNPERIHPNLVNKNLLNDQIKACRQYGIRTPIYITVQWDHFTAEEHPEWLVLDEQGCPNTKYENNKLYEAGFRRFLCVNSPYRNFLMNHTKEILDNFDLDGLFFDIVKPTECSCKYCRAGMIEEGLDPSLKENRIKYANKVIESFKIEMSNFIRNYNQECTIFYNQGHIGVGHRSAKEAFSHFEVESLPSGHWGYLHFPLTMHYARTLGKECLAHTGKFHTTWGDFHSFKNKAALEFECFRMLALNAKCLVGDQLEPSGKISKPVYELIGSVYHQIERKENWCIEAKAVTDIGVFTSEEFNQSNEYGLSPEMLGVIRILQESGHQFDIIDSESDIFTYKVLILPDQIPVSKSFANKLNTFLENGGSMISSYRSGLNEDGTGFSLKSLGVEYLGNAPYSPDFIVPDKKIGQGLPETEHVMYLQGLHVKAQEKSHILAYVNTPYFNRTWEHYCSHRHAPSSGKIGYPGIVKNKKTIYFMHPIFSQYYENSPRWVKQLFLNALTMLLPEPVIKHDGPSTLLTSVNEQQTKKRWVVHALHYIPERRSKSIDTIEDVIPLHNVNFSVKTTNIVRSIRLVPEQKAIPFSNNRGRIEFTLPKLNGHQMIELKL